MAASDNTANTISGSQDLTINMHSLITADVLVKRVLELLDRAAEIASIDIDIMKYFEAQEEQKDSRTAAQGELKPSKDKITTPFLPCPKINNTNWDTDSTG